MLQGSDLPAWRAEKTVVIAAPMFHAWGFGQMAVSASMTCTMVMRRRFDPEATLALDRTADRAASRFDLARGNTLGFHRLQPVRAEVEARAALGEAVDAAFERFAELGFFRLQHVSSP